MISGKLTRENLKLVLPAGWYWLLLALIDLRIRYLPYAWNRGYLSSGSGAAVAASSRKAHDDTIAPSQKPMEHLMRPIRSAAARPWRFNMGCLRRALLLRSLLSRRGISGVLVYGAVPKGTPDTPFLAHCWLVVESPEHLRGLALDPGMAQEGLSARLSPFQHGFVHEERDL